MSSGSPTPTGDGGVMLVLEDRPDRPEATTPVCAADGMPLFDTIVGPRCPLCGAAGLH